MATMWKLVSVTSEQYKLMDVDPAYLYFITDTGALMKGSAPFNTAFIVVDTLPDKYINEDMIYILKGTLEGKVYIEGKWVTIIYSLLSGNIDEKQVQSFTVNADQVKKYINDKIKTLDIQTGIKSLSYDVLSKSIKYTTGTEAKSIELDGLIDGLAIKDRNLLISIVGVDEPLSIPIPKTLVTANKAGQLLISKADGSFDVSGYTVGNNIIDGETNKLATEIGVMKLLEIEVYKS